MLTVDEIRCTVCASDKPELRTFGGRHYCEIHYHQFYEDSRPLWQACIVTFGSLILAIVASATFSLVVNPSIADTPYTLPAIATASVPGLVWLVALYRNGRVWQNVLSPLIPLVAITGVLTAAAISHPYFRDVLKFSLWLSETTAVNRLLGNILLGGFFHTFIAFLVIRVSAWTNSSFHKRVTGIELTLSFTIGYAAMLEVLYVFDNGGLLVLSGTLRLISMLCGLAAPSLVLGYFVGISRFEDLPFVNMVIGFSVSAVLSGLMAYIASETGYVGLSLTQNGFSPWPGTVICLVITVGTFIAIYGLIQRQNHIAEARIEPGR